MRLFRFRLNERIHYIYTLLLRYSLRSKYRIHHVLIFRLFSLVVRYIILYGIGLFSLRNFFGVRTFPCLDLVERTDKCAHKYRNNTAKLIQKDAHKYTCVVLYSLQLYICICILELVTVSLFA